VETCLGFHKRRTGSAPLAFRFFAQRRTRGKYARSHSTVKRR